MKRESLLKQEKPLSVSQLTFQIKSVLERQFPRLWVVGEISNFKRAASGHWYFSLKDEQSQIRCNMWRSQTNGVGFKPKDGAEVLVSGTLNVYQPRGEYSLIVDHMEELGLGRLKIEFERLKTKLREEGLFDQTHKKLLPLLPRKIGVVTSPTGAAIRDMLRVLQERFGGLHVLIYPARVQGAGAAEEIARGIQYLDREGSCQVLIAGRGGGSEEDLWAFNEEVVARAIFAARTPIISAVGHEVDFTIADFVADVRAATPSNAAEIVVRSHLEYRQSVRLHQRTMERAMQRRLLRYRNRINLSESHPIFIRVRSRINFFQRRLADWDHRIQRGMGLRLRAAEKGLMRAGEKLRLEPLARRIDFCRQRLHRAETAQEQRLIAVLQQHRNRLALLINRLEDLSPLKVLGRGYAAVYDKRGKLVRDAGQVRFGQVIRVQLAKGELNARVIETPSEVVQPSLF